MTTTLTNAGSFAMTEFDAVAEQHQAMDGMPLVDYLPIALPIYLLQIEALIAEKRELMPVEEFALKAVSMGVRSSSDVLGTLGLGAGYGEKLLQSLADDEYIAQRPELVIRQKGANALAEAGERRVYEKVLTVAWNPVTQQVMRDKHALKKSGEMKLGRVIRVVPPSTKLPPLDELPLERMPAWQLDKGEQVIRFLEVQRRSLLYVPAVLLIYGRGKGGEPLARVAIDGVIDSTSSVAIARHEVLPRLGVDGLFARRMGATAVEPRVKPLGVLPGNESLADLLKLKSTLQLGIEGLERKASPEAAAKLDAKKSELATAQQKLAQFPVRALLPFEVPQLVDVALQKAKNDIVITTTLPIGERLTSLRLLLLEQALRKGVKVRILISDRPTEDEFAVNDGPGPILRTLNDMMAVHANFDVSFLRDTDRVVFEVRMDDTLVGVSNEPPLGARSREPLARVFSGYQLSGTKPVRAYTESHMSAQHLAVVGKIKFPAPNRKPPGKTK
ncbi:hypothetical protein J2W23_001234 [Variovorax boronicumulans]|uniref:hypothetical protein n=1 Tax=Variovorax boronicumulans TaxID=436515 RepID=UPI0027821D72|nr:hypothetical protein [Variovorax boronicumulans]MDQ0012855.1 hypothetical protein [Variovorax boronicumulans]